MEKPQQGLAFVCMLILFLGLVSFSACIASEFKKLKAKDVKLDGNQCYLPRSPAFGLGIVASICLVAIQTIGSLVIFKQFQSPERKSIQDDRKPSVAISLVVLSWISTGIAIVLLGVATSMNQEQPYGKGWLDGECYLVKDGVYIGSAGLVLSATSFVFGSIFSTTNTGFCRKQVEQGKKVYALSLGR